MDELLAVILVCVIAFLVGFGLGVVYAKKVKEEVLEKLEIVEGKVDYLKEKVKGKDDEGLF